jgi:hypothetical protein
MNSSFSIPARLKVKKSAFNKYILNELENKKKEKEKE